MPLDLSTIDAPYLAEEAIHSGAPSASVQARALNEGFDRRDRRGLHPLLLSLPIAGALGDAASTNYFFSRANAANARGMEYATANPGTHIVPAPVEYGPWMKSHAGRSSIYPAKGLVGLGISGAAEGTARLGHRNLGKIIATVGSLGLAGLAANNLIQARRADRLYR